MFQLNGKVITGLGKGRHIGFPTINLHPGCAPATMEHGVYVAKIHTVFGNFGGVLHYGKRYIHDGKVSLEIYCFGLDKDLYGTSVAVEAIKKLRDVYAFKNAEELKLQIEKDVAAAKKELNSTTLL